MIDRLTILEEAARFEREAQSLNPDTQSEEICALLSVCYAIRQAANAMQNPLALRYAGSPCDMVGDMPVHKLAEP